MTCGFNTRHTARVTIDLLRREFGEHFIARLGPVNWPTRSYYLTPLNYFFWGYVKPIVYIDKPASIDEILRYRPKCWKEYAKIGLIGWTI